MLIAELCYSLKSYSSQEILYVFLQGIPSTEFYEISDGEHSWSNHAFILIFWVHRSGDVWY